MTRSIEDAITWAMGQVANRYRDWTDACQSFCRQTYDIGGGAADATGAWDAAQFRHAWTDDAPRGALVYATGGALGHGHVVLSIGGGYAISTDAIRRGWPDVIHYPTLFAHWSSLDPAGWTEDTNGVRFMNFDQQQGEGGGIPLPPPDPPAQQEDEMSKLVKDTTTGVVYALTVDTVRHITNPPTLLALTEEFDLPDPVPISNGRIQGLCESAATAGRLRPCACGFVGCEVAALNAFIAANNPW